MRQIAKFVVGSRAFFEGIPGFAPSDTDTLYIMDTFGQLRSTQLRFRLDGEDKILAPCLSKQQYIKDTIDSDATMRMGKFFVPEFAKWIGLKVEELKEFEKYLYRLDRKHFYYRSIYDSYMKNGGFYLTGEQREEAYRLYLEGRMDPAQKDPENRPES